MCLDFYLVTRSKYSPGSREPTDWPLFTESADAQLRTRLNYNSHERAGERGGHNHCDIPLSLLLNIHYQDSRYMNMFEYLKGGSFNALLNELYSLFCSRSDYEVY